MGLSLRGQTSGAVDINAPDEAGDNTITLPNGNGSINQFYKNSHTAAGIITHSSMVENEFGNVGIGTDDPGVKLSVWAAESVTDRDVFQVRSTTGAFNIQVSDSDAANPEWSLRTYANEPIVFKQGTAERLRITSTGEVGVNTTTVAAGVNVAVGGTIRVQDTTNAAQYLAISHQGIDFQNTGAGSSDTATGHILDDYEEGTWTVVCANGVTVYAANDQMSYTKIGRQVTVTGQFRVNSGNSNSNLYITSLPFVAASNTENEFLSVGAVRVYQGAIRGTAVQVIAVGADGTGDLYINEVRDNATDEPLTASNDAFYMISYTYFTA